ncbi:hypothetical protein CBOM_08043 [Ceraceosorus bombacis]|uniref:Uncharacterized protein n=1 Tax=Ceraceosorus bombacis TaxID=401625 RepID=A0A0N7LAH0_9BASI|nr:hypothetical protein CBOM_08043 [Ceraceosorus bombacis]
MRQDMHLRRRGAVVIQGRTTIRQPSLRALAAQARPDPLGPAGISSYHHFECRQPPTSLWSMRDVGAHEVPSLAESRRGAKFAGSHARSELTVTPARSSKEVLATISHVRRSCEGTLSPSSDIAQGFKSWARPCVMSSVQVHEHRSFSWIIECCDTLPGIAVHFGRYKVTPPCNVPSTSIQFK